MVKFIQLKLLKIKYAGDSIGDDIQVEIEMLGKFLRIDKTIKVAATAEIDKEIGNFETDRKSFEAGRWTEIYNALIMARKDSTSVGVLEVVD